MRRLRILVVEDSLTVRKKMVEALAADNELEVVGEASDGKRAIELCGELRPDAITLDMILPVLSGLAVTEYVMAYCPTPILVVSSSTNRGDLYKTYDALAAGAVDVLEKPGEEEPPGEWERKLISTVKLVSRIRVITHPRARLGACRSAPWAGGRELPPQPEPYRYRLVAIGASTGGPAALVAILQALPADFPLPVVLVTHIAASFDRFLAEWLDSRSSLRVRCAVDGEPLPPPGRARVLMATPDKHLVLDKGHLRLTDGPERHSCRPSIDVLFESVAADMGAESIACLLTGMGRDGAEGLMTIRRAGGRTLVQDEASSTIFGMPREAIHLGAAERILGLSEFAPVLESLAK